MGKPKEHKGQALHNRRFHDQVVKPDEEEYSDWAITSLFYHALHIVDTYLAQRPKPVDPRNHYDRETAMRAFCPKAWPVYRGLQGASHQARYMFAEFTPEQIKEYRDDAYQKLPALLR